MTLIWQDLNEWFLLGSGLVNFMQLQTPNSLLVFVMICVCHVFLEGASSVMVARAAMWNASIFSPKGKIHWEDVKREYVRKVDFSCLANFNAI